MWYNKNMSEKLERITFFFWKCGFIVYKSIRAFVYHETSVEDMNARYLYQWLLMLGMYDAFVSSVSGRTVFLETFFAAKLILMENYKQIFFYFHLRKCFLNISESEDLCYHGSKVK